MNSGRMREQELKVIAGIRSRVEQCRRLAAALTDKRAADVLLQMAEEGEADIRRLESQAPEVPMPPPAAQ
jgi:hypothetical protein